MMSEEDKSELARLGRYLHSNYASDTKEIAEYIGKGTIVDVAIEVLGRLDTRLGEGSAKIEELESEIARHHRDFAIWEEMAHKGAEKSEENTRLHARVVKLEGILEDYNLKRWADHEED